MPRPLIQAIGKPVDLLRHVGRPDFWVSVKGRGNISLSGSTVTGITDLSGNGRHLSSGTGSPVWDTKINNCQSVRFDGNDRLDGSTDALWSNSIGIHIFAVVQSITVRGVVVSQWNQDVNNRAWMLHSDRFHVQDDPTTFDTDDSTPAAGIGHLATAHILSGSWFPGSQCQIWRNGVVEDTAVNSVTDVSPTTAQTFQLGAKSDSGPQPLTGEIGEVIIYSRKLLNRERVLVERYLSSEWQLGLY